MTSIQRSVIVGCMTTNTLHKPASFMGMEPVDDIDSYDDVRWFRKQWFALFPLPPMAIVTIFMAFTGSIYTQATPKMKEYSDAEVWRYTAAARAFFVACGSLVLASFTWFVWNLVA